MKFLIILGLIGYVFYKVGNMFFRAGAASQQNRYEPRNSQAGNVNTNTAAKKQQGKGTIKGGEYVDYEEVK